VNIEKAKGPEELLNAIAADKAKSSAGFVPVVFKFANVVFLKMPGE